MTIRSIVKVEMVTGVVISFQQPGLWPRRGDLAALTLVYGRWVPTNSNLSQVRPTKRRSLTCVDCDCEIYGHVCREAEASSALGLSKRSRSSLSSSSWWSMTTE
ncbi:hypothetical protein CRG98_042699 [Punica granatum]|uniref:Uncharacterized protein n=1 Tax=Punica granatum TaxID=22663 RepID=A0A2I0HYY8_PUNGR|nr:hypothetical protein CRG98_042699 [Punica granatum]